MLTRLTTAALILLISTGCSDDPKKAVNEACNGHTDCADNICHYGICASPTPVDNGQPCAGPGNCLSFNCQTGKCAPGQLASGATCRFKEECAGGLCVGGYCGNAPPPDGGVPDARPDKGKPDMPRPDLARLDSVLADQKKIDAARPDLPAPDQNLPDQTIVDMPTPDMPAPDMMMPDMPVPDMLIPDMMMPDMPVPDMPVPDMLAPDMLLPDITPPDAAVPYSVWKQLTIPTGFEVHKVVASGKQILLGGKHGTGGKIFWSHDSGKTWTQSNQFSNAYFSVYLAIDGTDAAALGSDGKIWVSTDSGKNFYQKHDCWNSYYGGGIAIHKGHVLAAGRDYICWGTTAQTTPYNVVDLTDPKITTLGPSKATPKDVALNTYKGQVIGMVVGWSPLSNGWHYAYRNVGMGSNWTDIASNMSATQATPNQLSFASTGDVYALQSNGVLFISKDAGQSWLKGSAGTNPTKTYGIAQEVPAAGPNTVFVAGQTTKISLDGGGLFTDVLGLPKVGGRWSAVAFNGQGKAILVQYFPSNGTSVVLEGTP